MIDDLSAAAPQSSPGARVAVGGDQYRTGAAIAGWTAALGGAAWPTSAVDVWRVPLLGPPDLLRRMEQLLACDELERARRFYFERDRSRFILCRGALRTILASYAGLDAQEIAFQYEPAGKPAVLQPAALETLQFNVAHSHNLALIAVSAGRQLGVDIEQIRAMEDLPALAERFFAPTERRALFALPESQMLPGFFSCWVRKEAYIKARGEGLSIPLDEFTVSLDADRPSLLLRGYQDDTERWLLRALPIDSEYAAALAVEGAGWHLQLWDWLPA